MALDFILAIKIKIIHHHFQIIIFQKFIMEQLMIGKMNVILQEK